MSQVEQCLCRAFAGIEGDILFEISVKRVHALGGK